MLRGDGRRVPGRGRGDQERPRNAVTGGQRPRGRRRRLRSAPLASGARGRSPGRRHCGAIRQPGAAPAAAGGIRPRGAPPGLGRAPGKRRVWAEGVLAALPLGPASPAGHGVTAASPRANFSGPGTRGVNQQRFAPMPAPQVCHRSAGQGGRAGARTQPPGRRGILHNAHRQLLPR